MLSFRRPVTSEFAGNAIRRVGRWPDAEVFVERLRGTLCTTPAAFDVTKPPRQDRCGPIEGVITSFYPLLYTTTTELSG